MVSCRVWVRGESRFKKLIEKKKNKKKNNNNNTSYLVVWEIPYQCRVMWRGRNRLLSYPASSYWSQHFVGMTCARIQGQPRQSQLSSFFLPRYLVPSLGERQVVGGRQSPILPHTHTLACHVDWGLHPSGAANKRSLRGLPTLEGLNLDANRQGRI